MRRIAIINQKGGVGKSTTTVNLGHALALAGKRVMLIDLDPQGQLSASLGIFRPPAHGIDQVLLGRSPISAVCMYPCENLVVVPAGKELGKVERLNEDVSPECSVLGMSLEHEVPNLDFVLFDCPPASGLLTSNALMAADEALIPVSGDYLALNGIAHLLATIKRLESFRAHPLQKWIVITRFYPRRKLSQEVMGKLQLHFPGRILGKPICEAAVLAECPAVGKTIFEYRRSSKSAEEFRLLARDLIKRRVHDDG